MDDLQHDVILQRLIELRQRPDRTRMWISIAVLVSVGCWMLLLGQYSVSLLTVWDLQDPARVLAWLGQVLVRFSLHALVFFLLGLLVPGWAVNLWQSLWLPSLPPARLSSGRLDPADSSGVRPSASDAEPTPRRWRHAALAIALHSVLAVAYTVLAIVVALYLFGALGLAWGPRLAGELAVAVFGLLAGIWLGAWWRSSWFGFTRLLAGAVAVVLFLVAGTVALARSTLESQPLAFEQTSISSADKRALVAVTQRKSLTADGQRLYQFTPADLNKLLAWWLNAARLEGKARVELSDQLQEIMASVNLASSNHPPRYLNVSLYGNCVVFHEELELQLDSLQIGAVTVPQHVIGWCGRFAAHWLSLEENNLEMLTGIVQASADSSGLDVVLASGRDRSWRLAQVLRQLGDHPDVSDAVSEHLGQIAHIVSRARPKEPLFDDVVRTAFQTARRRQQQTGDAQLENRAAILALGIALGHVDIERFVGECMPDPAVRSALVRLLRQSELRGRPDWARHFWVSAAVTLLANDRVSDAAGLLKEELDADETGSGFSFGDLMADRAGTEFALAATRNRSSAQAIQAWVLARDTDLNELMPPAGDLLEGLRDTDMQSQFDGVGGQGFLEKKAELERRLSEVPWRQ